MSNITIIVSQALGLCSEVLLRVQRSSSVAAACSTEVLKMQPVFMLRCAYGEVMQRGESSLLVSFLEYFAAALAGCLYAYQPLSAFSQVLSLHSYHTTTRMYNRSIYDIIILLLLLILLYSVHGTCYYTQFNTHDNILCGCLMICTTDNY